VHDIGKSLVNTILTNNGYTVVDLGKQVPIQTILDAAKEHDATAIGLSALLVSTSKQMPLAIQELHSQGLEYPVLLGGAAINRKFALRALYPKGKEDDTVYEPGVFYCQDAFDGLAVMDRLIDAEKKPALVEEVLAAGVKLRETGEEEEVLDTSDDTVRSGRPHRRPGPDAAVLGRARDRGRHGGALHPARHARAVQAALGRARREGRGVAQAARGGLPPAPGAHVGRGRLPASRGAAGLLPVLLEGNDIVVLDPEDRETVLERFTCPRQPKGDRLCLADFYRPKESGELDVVALQAVTVGAEVTELMAKLEADGEFAEQLFVHGLGVQTAEGLAEWLHWRVRNDLGIDVRRAAATRGATRPCRTSPSTSRSSSCSASSRSAWRSPTATRRSRAVHARARSPTTRRPATTACATAGCCPTARPNDVIRGTDRDPVAVRRDGRRRTDVAAGASAQARSTLTPNCALARSRSITREWSMPSSQGRHSADDVLRATARRGRDPVRAPAAGGGVAGRRRGLAVVLGSAAWIASLHTGRGA
jgi:5-methyltetrahydrofolate--homocysteine methyltransferase